MLDLVPEQDNKKEENSQILSEVNSEMPTEINAPLEKVKEEDKNKLTKSEMCQLIYYDFSLK
jgi:hypothetical protein